jgi:hypothetical protein
MDTASKGKEMTLPCSKPSRSLLHGAILFAILFAFLAAVVAIPQEAAAVPAFARQTGMACTACHFQHFPAINAFGRAFKRDGFTLKGAQSTVEAVALSIPVALNASLVTKIRYQKSNGDTSDTDFGEFQFPNEADLLIGGRAGEHVGFLFKLATFGEAEGRLNPDNTVDSEFSLFDSFKAHFTWKVRDFNLGAVLFSTANGGAAFGFELLNTGLQRGQRIAEERTASSAHAFVGLGATAAEGIALVASHPMGFVNYSFWTPDHGDVAINGFASYLRAAATPQILGWDTGFGGAVFFGETSRIDGDADTKGWALDAQAQGMVIGRPLGVYLAYAKAEPSATNIFNASAAANAKDRDAWSILAEFGVIPNKWTVYAGYLDGDRGGTGARTEDDAITVGTTYMVAQNIELQLSNVSFDGNRYEPKPAAGGDNRTTLMLFAGF